MHQAALHQPSKHHTVNCRKFATVAEQELGAFFRAVTKQFGSEQATLSAEDWLHELETSTGIPASMREYRLITIRVAKRLADRVNMPATRAAL
jgi:hypothetical protein